jgi:hypothetical protein
MVMDKVCTARCASLILRVEEPCDAEGIEEHDSSGAVIPYQSLGLGARCGAVRGADRRYGAGTCGDRVSLEALAADGMADAQAKQSVWDKRLPYIAVWFAILTVCWTGVLIWLLVRAFS